VCASRGRTPATGGPALGGRHAAADGLPRIAAVPRTQPHGKVGGRILPLLLPLNQTTARAGGRGTELEIHTMEIPSVGGLLATSRTEGYHVFYSGEGTMTKNTTSRNSVSCRFGP